MVIANGQIVDGTASPWYEADVGIRDGHIAAVGRLDSVAAKSSRRRLRRTHATQAANGR
ncbi:MAG: hypothetical protein ABSH56_34375 [Bryobacteraceae bacterium]